MLELVDTDIVTKKDTLINLSEFDEDTTRSIYNSKILKQEPAKFFIDVGSTSVSERAMWKFGTLVFHTNIDRESFTMTEDEELTIEFLDQFKSDDDEAETGNRDRIRLLERKFDLGHLSSEEAARLKIATEKIRKLIPRVKVEDFERLAEVAEEIKKIKDADIKLRDKLGLSES